MQISKEIITGLLFMAFSSMLAGQGKARHPKPIVPKWTVAKGFWVIESNIHTPENSIVRFYTDDAKLVYSEQVNDVINVKKKRTRMKLKRALDKVIAEWEKNGIVRPQDELVLVSGRND